MSDSTSNRGTPDSKRINIHEDYELDYWSKKWNVSKQDIKNAVHKAGTSVESVKKELNK